MLICSKISLCKLKVFCSDQQQNDTKNLEYMRLNFRIFRKIKLNVYASLKNNIDTTTTIKILHELVGSIFIYVTIVESSETYMHQKKS